MAFGNGRRFLLCFCFQPLSEAPILSVIGMEFLRAEQEKSDKSSVNLKMRMSTSGKSI